MENLYFVRHGESEANAAKRIAGSQESPLTNRGREQAKKLGRELLETGILFDHIISSPLERAHHTAEIIAEHIDFPKEEIVIEESVRERSAGILEGELKREVFKMRPKESVMHGEPFDVFAARALQFWQKAQELDGNVLLVAHSGVGKMLDIVSKDGDPETLFEHPGFKNAMLTKIAHETEASIA